MNYQFRNVNDAFFGLVWDMERLGTYSNFTRQTDSRAGKVRMFCQPVMVTYTNPLERVLFNRARDANPFFHLFESLWMLAGRNDVAPLAYYNSKISEIASDDGVVFNGAYGHRWRTHFQDYGKEKFDPWTNIDQLYYLIEHLRKSPNSRRSVLEIYDASHDLMLLDETKDIPCNTHAYFSLRQDEEINNKYSCFEEDNEYEGQYDTYLDMTVCNRSNDLVWGMLGANVVHFSFLQEYMAACIGVKVGLYIQFTNNLHAYLNRFEPGKWIHDKTEFDYDHCTAVPLVKDPSTFDFEVGEFIDNKDWTRVWQEPFLNTVAAPMCWAFELHKRRDYRSSLNAIETIAAGDWRLAARNWIEKRKANWEKKSAQASTD
jgi:thymidylate synthase